MNLFDRIILSLCTILLAIISVILIIFSSGLIKLQNFWTRIVMLHGSWEAGLVGVILLIASVRLLLSGLKIKHYPEAIIKNDQMGNISISLNAIENLVLKISQDIEKVKDVKTKIKKQDDGISVLLKLIVTNDVNIPEMTSELQKAVKDYIETTAGILVKDVSINVENVLNPYSKQKVLK